MVSVAKHDLSRSPYRDTRLVVEGLRSVHLHQSITSRAKKPQNKSADRLVREGARSTGNATGIVKQSRAMYWERARSRTLQAPSHDPFNPSRKQSGGTLTHSMPPPPSSLSSWVLLLIATKVCDPFNGPTRLLEHLQRAPPRHIRLPYDSSPQPSYGHFTRFLQK